MSTKIAKKKKKQTEKEEEEKGGGARHNEQEIVNEKEVRVAPAVWRLAFAVIFAVLAVAYSASLQPAQTTETKERNGNQREGGRRGGGGGGGSDFFQGSSIVDGLHERVGGESLLRSRLWGTYRSGQYLGIRAALPRSPLFGMMWLVDSADGGGFKLRHDADARDSLTKYGWVRHDGKAYGRQEIVDGNVQVR